MCGNPEAMDDWSPLASHYGTLVVLRADVPCGDRPGSKWPQDVNVIQSRIDRAIEAVAERRGGVLDRDELVLIGYSQGAHRGERLAEAFPERYPYLILGGPPGTASPERLARARAVAILGGERENTEHMRAGVDALSGAGLRARFFLLPRVGHGAYGPEAPQVLGQVFAWLFAP
jgi:pimeloyl-ACP methyl ester carboxylesterase